MTTALRLSVILITKNEAERLPRCLESVRGLADEIVVLDSGSSDATLEIARRYTDQVHSSADWPPCAGLRLRRLGAVPGR